MSEVRHLKVLIIGLILALCATTASADDHEGSIVDRLSAVDGAQALVAAVLVVDESNLLDFSLAAGLSTVDNLLLLAPTNPAFEALLGLETGFLDGLSVDQIKAALPSVLEGLGLTAANVLDILLLHVGVIADVDEAGAEALLADGGVSVAGSSEPLPVSLGSKGVRINYEATVIKADVFTDNGVIHFIDTVLVDDLLAQ